MIVVFLEESDLNDIIKIIVFVLEDKIIKIFGLFEFSLCEVDKVIFYYGVMKIVSNLKVIVMELENIVIDCVFFLRCRFCVFFYIIGDKLEGMKFRGCFENNKISEFVFGECLLFISRRVFDE